MLDHIESYYYARSPHEAAHMLLRDGAAVIAGGTILVAEGAPGVKVLVDISAAGLDAIRSSDDGLTLGATATLQQLAESPAVPPALAAAARACYGRLLRNAATVGGIVARVPAESDVLAVLLALDAQLRVLSTTGERMLSLQDHLAGTGETLRRQEILTEIVIPAGGRVAYRRVSRGEPDRSTAAAAVWRGQSQARVSLGGLKPRPYRLAAAEAAITAGQSPETVQEIVRTEAVADSDFLASAEYRRTVAGVLVRRSLESLA